MIGTKSFLQFGIKPGYVRILEMDVILCATDSVLSIAVVPVASSR